MQRVYSGLENLRRGPPRSFTLRQHLSVLVLLTAVPLMALALFVSLDRFWAERQANRTSLMVNARVLAAAVESELATYIAIIHTLSKSPTLLSGNLQAFWQAAKDASAFVPGSWVIVAEPGGQQFINTLRPFGDPLPRRAAEAMPWVERAFVTKQPQVSDIFRGAVAQRSVVNIEMPVFHDGAPLYVLSIGLAPERFHNLLQQQKYPPGWLLGILDRQARFVARIPEHEQRVGTMASEGWRAEIARAPEGWGEHLSVEGERVHTAYATTQYGWIVGLSLPESRLYAAARRSLWILATFGSFLLALSLALAWLASSRIAKPADYFAVAASEMKLGRVPAIGKTGIKEFDGVVQQFENAAAAIREHTQQQTLLLHELSHRVKNILAVVQSLVMRTLSGERAMSEARDILINRLHALGRAHELLMGAHWKGAPLMDIVTAELEPFSAQVHLDGPPVMIEGRMVQTLALVLHELATNASKHGSLSNPNGKVSISWSVTGSGKDARFKFRWQEQDGPVVQHPSRSGFGSTLLRAAIPGDLNVEPRLSFDPAGLIYELEAPLSELGVTPDV